VHSIDSVNQSGLRQPNVSAASSQYARRLNRFCALAAILNDLAQMRCSGVNSPQIQGTIRDQRVPGDAHR
jgi:hypothetical protein